MTSPYILALRLALMIAAGGALVAAIGTTNSLRHTGRPFDSRYVCPMHPEVASQDPGSCPICGMGLERATIKTSAPPAPSEAVGLVFPESARRHDLIDFVRSRSLQHDAQELRGPAWVESDGTLRAIFYCDQIESITKEDLALFTPSGTPHVHGAVRRTSDPPRPWDGSTSQLRFRPEAADSYRPRPGEIGWVVLPRKAREVVAVPAGAILQSSSGPYVLAFNSSDRIEKRPVAIGETFGTGLVVVLWGLRPLERVVTKAAFFVDAERRLNESTDFRGGSAP